ncbi:MAG: substrate-binding domain-containing protein [Methylobacteriaceae bacterium]|nr:substrate-binding domain-containing protein [Methylobacteriaceae bacterium]
MNPSVLILDEPTHGIDVGTKGQVHQIIRTLADSGLAILMISSDPPEVLRMGDRIVVVADGRVTATFERNEASEEKIMSAAPEGGKSIWVAPTPTVANFISQKKALDELIAKDPKYKSIQFIDTLYANDDPDKSSSVATAAMQAHPDVKLFISGSGISNPAINKAIQDTNRSGKVFSTGFALPSTMKTYLDSGTCKQYALWSPFKFGYMATYCAIMIKSGKMANTGGTEIDVPNIGKRTVEEGRIANLNSMLFFTKGHDDFDSALPMG